MKIGSLLVLTLAVFLTACNPVDNLDEAADQIDRFQSLFSNNNIDELYLMGSPQFRKNTSPDTFDSIVSAIRDRLGKVEASERVGFKLNTDPAGTTTVITMETRYKLGAGTETYTFIGNGENMRIEGWQVNSPLLLVNAAEFGGPEQAPSKTKMAD